MIQLKTKFGLKNEWSKKILGQKKSFSLSNPTVVFRLGWGFDNIVVDVVVSLVVVAAVIVVYPKNLNLKFG